MLTTTNVHTRPLELSKPEKLNDAHDFTDFDCGEESINDFLHKKARKYQEAKHSVVYVVCFKGSLRVAAYYTLSSGSVSRAQVSPKALQRNSPPHHPVTVLGRMGVTMSVQGHGLSKSLIKDAITKVVASSEVVATSAILVHPLNERLAEMYEKAGFVPCTDISQLTMMLSLR